MLKFWKIRGIIQGYVAKIDRNALGLGLTIIVQLCLEKHDRSAAEGFDAAVKKLGNVFDVKWFLEEMIRFYEKARGTSKIMADVAASNYYNYLELPVSNLHLPC